MIINLGSKNTNGDAGIKDNNNLETYSEITDFKLRLSKNLKTYTLIAFSESG